VKKYTLELTATEVWALSGTRLAGSGELREVRGKLAALDRQAVADRDAGELRLPWTAVRLSDSRWDVTGGGPDHYVVQSERAAKLMSAAPELLEAVKYISAIASRDSQGFWSLPPGLLSLVERALRKVETGVPEPHTTEAAGG
jgi:hypothetical protein